MRSRLVGKEFNDNELYGRFGGTPSLEALRRLYGCAAKLENGRRRCAMVNDVARAFFKAGMHQAICVELPTEEEAEEDEVGLLLKSLFGIKDANANFEKLVEEVLLATGFVQNSCNLAMSSHKGRAIRVLVLGDHFVSTSFGRDLNWLKEYLEARFKIKTHVVGTSTDEEPKLRVLNRVIRVDDEGWHYEDDQRHCELILRGLRLEGVKGVSTSMEMICLEKKQMQRRSRQQRPSTSTASQPEPIT
jgi:hypothetical protein